MSEITEGDKLRGVVTLDSCIRSAIMDIGAGMERYEQFKHWGLEAYRDFHFDMAHEIKRVALPFSAWKSIDIPIDFVDWVIIGVVVNGQIRTFTHDDRIALPLESLEEEDPDPVVTSAEPVTQDAVPFWFWNNRSVQGEDAGGFFGMTVKDNGTGYFKFNKERREIQFSPSVDTTKEVYMEYISDGIDPCEKTMVNIYAAKLIKLYIHWQRNEFAKSSNGLEKERAKDMYNRELFKVQGRLNPLTVDEIYDVLRQGYRLIQSV